MMKDYFSAVYDKHTAMFQTVIIRQTFSIFGIYMVVFLQTFSRICLSTVEPRYLELAYFELPLISKWKSGPCFNMKLWQQVTK